MKLNDILTPEELQALLTSEDEYEMKDSTYPKRRLEQMALRQQVVRLEETVQALSDRLERLEGRLAQENQPAELAAETRIDAIEEAAPPEAVQLTSRLEKHARKRNRWFPREN